MAALVKQILNDRRNNRAIQFLEAGNLSDCEFVVGALGGIQKTFRCHKLLLTLASPVFEAMFYGPLAEGSQIIYVSDIEISAFETMLEYIYAAKTDIRSLDHGIDVAYVATKYMLEHLQEECVNYLSLHVTSSTVCHILELALLIDSVTLQERCIQIIQNDAMEILLCDSFRNITVSTLEKIVKFDEMNISSELDLFEAVQKWAITNSQERCTNEEMRCKLLPVLKEIRFLSMSPKQFAEGPANSPLLTKDEVLAILMNSLTAEATKYPMPHEFCTLRKSRCISTYNNLESYQVGSKIYCVRTIVNPEGAHINCKNEVKECFLKMKCNRKIFISGIQVATQIRPENDRSKTYAEDIKVDVFDSNGTLVRTARNRERVRYDSLVELSILPSISVVAGLYYKFHVLLLQEGKYPNAQCQLSASIFEQANFNFKSIVNDGIIRSFICHFE